MATKKELYLKLLNLTQLYLLREFSLQESKQTDPLIYQFFQTHLKKPSNPPPIHHPILSTPIQKHSSPSSTPLPKFQSTPSPISSPTPPHISSPPIKPTSTAPNAIPHETSSWTPSTHPKIQESPPLPSLPPPTPPIPPEATSVPANKKKEFSLEPLKPSTPSDFHEFWKNFPSLFPQWLLSQSTPNDTLAKKNRDRWIKKNELPSVFILAFHNKEPQLSFLKNIAHAISLRFAPAKVISTSLTEKESSWENLLNPSHLRLIIASDYELYLEPQLMRLYQENRQEGKHTLNNIPLLLLSDPSLYLKDPQLKPFLWRALCNEFSNSKRES